SPHDPITKMGGECVEIEIETIAGERRDAARRETPVEIVDQCMCRILRARTQMQHGDQLADRINRQPQPQRVHAAPQPSAELVELDMQQVQVPQGAVVQRRTVPPRTCQPGGDGSGTVAKNPHGSGHREPFGHGRQHLTYALGRRFEPIEWRVSTGRKRGATGLAAQRLDALYFPLSSVADQRMDVRIRDLIVLAGAVGAGEPLGIDPFGRTATAFDLTPGRDARAHRDGARVGRCPQAADRAGIGRTWFEEPLNLSGDCGTSLRVLPTPPDPDQPDQQDQEQQRIPAPIEGHGRPRDMDVEQTGLPTKDTEGSGSCQAVGRQGAELSTVERGTTRPKVLKRVYSVCFKKSSRYFYIYSPIFYT